MSIEVDSIINKNSLFAYRWVPMVDAVRRSKNLTDGAKILYNEICSFIFQKSKVVAWPGQDLLSENLGVDRRSIIRRLKELEKVELIGIDRRGRGQTNRYFLMEINLEKLGVWEDEKGNIKQLPAS